MIQVRAAELERVSAVPRAPLARARVVARVAAHDES